jgi:molecular chaperone GrpE (heat shock protein)
MSEKNNYAIPAVRVLIYNQKNEILLIKNSKWLNVWTIPGGKVEEGGHMEKTAIREINEETGLKIDDLEFISISDGLNPKQFYSKKHFIFLNYIAREAGGKLKKSREVSDYIWLKPQEALKRKDISDTALPVILDFLKKLEKKEDKDEDYKSKYQRALADFQNLIKKNDQERKEFIKFALVDFLQELLPIYDHLKLSLIGLPETEKKSAWVVGVEHILRQLKELLNSKGVKEVETIGHKFDHNLMEAIEGEGEVVIKEISPGYTLDNRLLRPAKVIVANDNKN